MRDHFVSLALASSMCLAVMSAGFGAWHVISFPADAHALSDLASVPSSLVGIPGDPEVLTEHRQAVMRAAGGHMTSVAAILFDGAPFQNDLAMHGSALAGLLADIPAQFPEGSDHPDSDTRPETWTDWDTFLERAENTRNRAAAFAEATQGGDPSAMIQTFQALGESCGACHDVFRN
jgi:cytochrome c556